MGGKGRGGIRQVPSTKGVKAWDFGWVGGQKAVRREITAWVAVTLTRGNANKVEGRNGYHQTPWIELKAIPPCLRKSWGIRRRPQQETRNV